MSIGSIVVLALVAVVTVQAGSFSEGAKGGQSYYQEPIKGEHYQQQQFRQPMMAESYKTSQPAVSVAPAQQIETSVSVAPVQTYEAPAKGGQNFYQESISQPIQQTQWQQRSHEVLAPAPVLGQTYEAPTKGGQSFYSEAPRGQYVQQPLRQPVVESYRPVQQVAQAPAAQVEVAAPVALPTQSLSYEAPVKGGLPSYSEPLKGQFQQPLRQPVVESYRPVQQVAQAPATQVEVAAPVALPTQSLSYEAPVKGGLPSYSEPLKGQFQQPLRQPVVESYRPVQQISQPEHYEYAAAPAKGQSFFGLPRSYKH